jgi:AcrR family transcriptional regulator
MPPKKQLSKQQIIEKAFEMVQKEGYEALTARKLAQELHCSTQPIYQAFADMKELKIELINRAQERMVSYILDTLDNESPKPLAYILAYIRFAGEEKYLFQLIFTSGGLNLRTIDGLGINPIELDINMIIYANGMIMMLAYHTLEPDEEKLRDMLTRAYELFENKK